MVSDLSPYRLNKAREAYNYFNVFNSISWNLLVGIIVTLFALRLGASSTYIGLIGSSVYVAHFMLPLGKIFAKRFSIIGIFSVTWILRSVSMMFAAAAPFLDHAGYRNLALIFIMLGLFSFHLLRGIGMIGSNPVLNLLASGSDRGSYLTQIQITNSAIGMFCSFLIAMVLGFEPPFYIFSVLLIAGVISGIISGNMIKKVPEPPHEEDSKKSNLINIFKETFSQDALRHFMIILFLVSLVSGVTRTFVVVFAREIFNHDDGLISLYSVFGGLGFLMAGLIVKFLVDKLGAKPLFLVCLIIGFICLVPIMFFPASVVGNVTGSILFMGFLFFMLNFGFLGSEGIAQTYFLALIPPEKMLDMSILYFFIFGIAGVGGTFLSGLLLDFMSLIGISSFVSFKILFGIMIALVIIALAMQKKMKPLGSLPLRDALEVIFSVRDLRAISLLGKLNKAQDSQEEGVLIGALHDTPSRLMVDDLLNRTRSPLLATRLESVRALEKLPTLSKTAEKALMDDAIHNHYTTAYISTRILGNQNCTDAIPLLRELAVSGDYMLAGEAIIALAKMKDEEFRPEIEKLVLYTQNPRLKIMGAEALGLYHNNNSIPVLLDILRIKNQPFHLVDEAVLAIAAILDTQKKFYKLLARYAANNSLAAALANDEVESAVEYVKTALDKKKTSQTDVFRIVSFFEGFPHSVSSYMEKNNGDEISRWILELPNEYSKDRGIVKRVLSEAAVDETLNGCISLRLLIVHWVAQKLRIWAVTIK